ncbi:MAG: hypothetical protein OJF49_001676 [Ktedonobacterales bacterium]|nr:MAG: hypothetical protein OJF49_001676 [Ktedonobacterales bacterium]
MRALRIALVGYHAAAYYPRVLPACPTGVRHPRHIPGLSNNFWQPTHVCWLPGTICATAVARATYAS